MGAFKEQTAQTQKIWEIMQMSQKKPKNGFFYIK